MAINATGDYVGGILDLFTPYTILGGLTVLSMFVTHGAIFVALKPVAAFGTTPVNSRPDSASCPSFCLRPS